jgi:nicotinamidase-related amidase
MTSRRMDKSIENITHSHPYQRLTADNSVLVLIDHQVGHLLTIKDIDQEELRHNVVASARAARVLGVPVILTSTAPNIFGPTFPELTEALPNVENIERSIINAWEDPKVRQAIKETGRRKILFAALTTHVCLAFPSISAASEGYDSYALLDASGTWNETLRVSAIAQMQQAGVIISSGLAAFIEMVHDNANPIAPEVYAALDLPGGKSLSQLLKGKT